MGRMTGADIDDLERGARSLSSIGSQIGGFVRPLRAQLRSSKWTGSAADRFRTEFDSVHARALLDAEHFLKEAGVGLSREAHQQRVASNSGHPRPGSGSSGGPRSLLQTLTRTHGLSAGWSGRSAVREDGSQWGTDEVGGNLGGTALSAEADASALLEAGPFGMRAEARARGRTALLEASGDAHFNSEYVAAEAEFDAMVGVEAGAEAGGSLGPDGVHAEAKAGAFVGGRVEAQGKADLGAVEVNGGAGLRSGFGADADGKLRVSLDEISLGVSLGAAVGVGGSVSGGFSVKPKELVGKLAKWRL